MSLLNIQVRDVLRVGFDEEASRLHSVAHERGEYLVGLDDVVELHLEEFAGVAGSMSFPRAVRVHFSQPFVALDDGALAAEILDRDQLVDLHSRYGLRRRS